MENRNLERYKLDLPVRLITKGESGEANVLELHTRDISSKGTFIQTGQPLPHAKVIFSSRVLISIGSADEGCAAAVGARAALPVSSVKDSMSGKAQWDTSANTPPKKRIL